MFIISLKLKNGTLGCITSTLIQLVSKPRADAIVTLDEYSINILFANRQLPPAVSASIPSSILHLWIYNTEQQAVTTVCCLNDSHQPLHMYTLLDPLPLQ